MEHWLPLVHTGLETVLDYVPEAAVTLDYQADEACGSRFEMIADFYEARAQLQRAEAASGSAVYKPLPPDRLYLKPDEWEDMLSRRPVGALSPFAAPDDMPNVIDRSEEHTSELQSLMRISYAVFCLKKK